MKMYKYPGTIVLLTILSFVTACFPALGQTSAKPDFTLAAGSPNKNMEADVLALVNKYRQSKGLTPLMAESNFAREALVHSQAMADKKTTFGHDGFEDRVKRLTRQTGLIRMSAENVAFGQLSANEVVSNWLKSPGHRKNIEGRYTITGVGIYQAKDGTLFFTQIFGAR